LFVLLAAASPALFALFTGNIWEDFFITYRCSLNLVQGHGLVFEVGRRLHVFTSPLGTLLPAGISWAMRTEDPQVVMFVFRAFACAALAGAWLFAARGIKSALAAGVTAAFWIFDGKLAAFATNGMETAFLVLFVVMAWWALNERRVVLAGVALAGALWTRPDGFVFVGAVAVGTLVFPGDKRLALRDWLRMGLVTTLIYAPWFFGAWIYYGSPVPNTIVAKGTHISGMGALVALAKYPFLYVFGHCSAHDAFLPPYYFFGGWPTGLWWYGKILALGAAAVAAWPRCARPARVAGLAFVLGGAYLTVTARAPWYFPAWQILAYIAIGGGVAALAEMLAGRKIVRVAIGVAVGGLILIQAALYVALTVQLREQQRIIEWGARAPLGRILQKLARSPQETVFLEPLGYIGFYSGLAMRDTPGLCAPEVIALRKAGTLSMSSLIVAVDPDWAVLRRDEFGRLSAGERAELESEYQLWSIYDVTDQVNAVSWLPGRDFLLFDAYYSVWRRRPPPANPP
jgi:hypothetical protein